MKWQDIVASACTVGFIVALLPTVFDPSATVPAFTSSLTAALLFILGGTFGTLRLYGTAASQFLLAALWGFVAVFRVA